MVSDRMWQCRGPVHPQGPGSGERRAAGWCSSPVHKITQPIKKIHAAVSSMSSVSLPRLGAVHNKRFYVRYGVFRTATPHVRDDLPGGIVVLCPLSTVTTTLWE
jgi:hypothetical protein